MFVVVQVFTSPIGYYIRLFWGRENQMYNNVRTQWLEDKAVTYKLNKLLQEFEATNELHCTDEIIKFSITKNYRST